MRRDSAAGSYRRQYRNSEGPSGLRVRLYRVARELASVLSTAPLKVQRTVGRLGPVKRELRTFSKRRWYQHPFFGDYASTARMARLIPAS